VKGNTEGNLEKKGLDELFPFNDLVTKLIANVLELPGFPHINKGILFRMQVIITNIFSLNGVFFPIPLGISI
jgi:hypothetical protein